MQSTPSVNEVIVWTIKKSWNDLVSDVDNHCEEKSVHGHIKKVVKEGKRKSKGLFVFENLSSQPIQQNKLSSKSQMTTKTLK